MKKTDKLIINSPKINYTDKILKSFPVFRTCSEKELNRTLKDAELIVLKKNELLFKNEENPSGIFLVESGVIKIVSSYGKNKKFITKFVGKCGIIGVEAAVIERKYITTGQVHIESAVYKISIEPFLKLIYTNRECFNKIIDLMGKDLDFAWNRIVGLSQKTGKQRLAEALVWLHDFFGVDDDMAVSIAVKPSDLAEFVGTALGNLYKLLTLIQNLGCIEYKYNKLKVLHHKKLVEIANSNQREFEKE